MWPLPPERATIDLVVRALIAVSLLGCAVACNNILGISDPKASGGPDDSGIDSAIDSNIDAPPPCTTSVSLKAEISSDVGVTGTGFDVGRLDTGIDEDLAIATGANVTIVHGDRTGAFTAAAAVTVPTAATDLVIADFDTDVNDDLAMWTKGGTAVIVRRVVRTMNPVYQAEQPLTGPFTSVQKVITANIDGAAIPDLFVYDSAAGSRAYFALLGTPGTFSRSANLVGNGADDLVFLRQIDSAMNGDAAFVNGSAVNLALGSNSGTFTNPISIATGANSKGIAFGKFSGDPLLGLVVSTANGLVLYRQMTAGQFTMQGVISPVQSATPMLVGDVNGDGRDDILTPTAAILQCANSVFTQVEPLAVGTVAQLVDVTGDDKPDLVRLDGTSVKVRVAP